MAHDHIMYDQDPHFSIDADTRTIKYKSAQPFSIIQGDHNSEIVTFDIPRVIDGHDMMECNSVQIHYININSAYTGTYVTGVYDVTDLNVVDLHDKEPGSYLAFSWLISGNATSLAGPLNFAIRFACLNGSEIEYVWHTSPCKDLKVSTGINNTNSVAEANVDILQEWYDKLRSVNSELAAEIGDIEAALDAIIAIQEKLTNPTITFAITRWGTTETYQADEGMTWAEWLASEYNTGNQGDEFVAQDSRVYCGINWVVDTDGNDVSITSEIIPNYQYQTV